jgi:general secretion pathway protein K
MSLQRQRGIALLVAITMFALTTTVAAAITYNKAMAARRAAATFTLEQALQAGMAAEAMAGLVLEDSGGAGPGGGGQQQTGRQTTLDEQWAEPLGPVEIPETGIWIAARLEDISGRFNLNSLIKWDQTTNSYQQDPHQVKAFKQLLQSLDLEERWAELVVDWIDPDNTPTGPEGGEDTLYLSQVPPYRPPNTFITSTSELLALPNFGAERFLKLAPHVNALPQSAKMNICTATGAALDAMRADGQSEFTGQDLGKLREKGCFPPLAAYTSVIADPTAKGEVEQKIQEYSDWFRLRTDIRIGTAEFVLYSVLYRGESGAKVRTVQRSFSTE